jgi:hypothetical protein
MIQAQGVGYSRSTDVLGACPEVVSPAQISRVYEDMCFRPLGHGLMLSMLKVVLRIARRFAMGKM